MFTDELFIVYLQAPLWKCPCLLYVILLPDCFLHVIVQVKQIDGIITLAQVGKHIVPEPGLFPEHDGIGDVLVISPEAYPIFMAFIPDASAAHIDGPPQRMFPGVLYFRPLIADHLINAGFYHGIKIMVNPVIPFPVAFLRGRHPFKAKEFQHGLIPIHPGFPSLFKLNGPQSGTGHAQKFLHTVHIHKMLLHTRLLICLLSVRSMRPVFQIP